MDYKNLVKMVEQRCLLCHGPQVQMKNVRLDTTDQLKLHAQNIYQQTVVARIMPMNNATGMTEHERQLVKRWFEGGARVP